MSTSNSTWGGMVALNLKVTVYCTPCDRSVELDMTKLPPDGNAIGVTFRCSKCGEKGRIIVSPGDHNPSNQMMGPDFYGKPADGPRPEPIRKRRRRR